MAQTNHEIDVSKLPVVTFDGRELELIEHIAALRNTTYDAIEGGRVHGPQSSIEAHETGTKGELAVAKFFDKLSLYDIKSLLPKGDGGVDFVIGDQSVDVKSTRTDLRIPDLIVPVDPAPTADWFVLTHIIDANKVRMIGMAHRRVVTSHPIREAPGTRENYWVPPEDLNLFHR